MTKQDKFSKISLVYFISVLMFICVRIASSLGVFATLQENVANTVFTIIIQLIVMGALPFILYMKIYKKEKLNKQNIKQSLYEIGFKKISIKTIIVSILLGVLVYFFNVIIASFFDIILSLLGYAGISQTAQPEEVKTWHLVFNMLLTAVMPAIFEEFLHRGILFKGIKESKNIKWAILCSGLFFGFMHININQFFYATIIGVFFAFITTITKNIWVPIILHFMNNAINVYLNWASKTKSLGYNFYSELNNFLQNNNMVIVFICILSVIFVMSALAIYFIIILNNEHNKNNKIQLRLLTPKQISEFVKFKNNLNVQNNKLLLDNTDTEAVPHTTMPSEHTFMDLFNIQNEKSEKVSFRYSIFFYAIVILGGLTTFFTFIWGIL